MNRFLLQIILLLVLASEHAHDQTLNSLRSKSLHWNMELGRMKTGYNAIARASHVPLIINAQNVLTPTNAYSKIVMQCKLFEN